MASPNDAVEKNRRQKKRRPKSPDTRVPWSLSVAFFVDVARVLLGTLLLVGLSLGSGDFVMPGWFVALLIIHGAAMIAALILVLNGFGWARWVVLALALLQLLFDQTQVTRYFLVVDVLVLVVFMLRPSKRYFEACEAVRDK